MSIWHLVRRHTVVLALAVAAGVSGASCGTLPFLERPAQGYVYGSGEPLRIAIVDETTRDVWSPAIEHAVRTYGEAAPILQFQTSAEGAHIVMTFRDYVDAAPPQLQGYLFPPNAGGFAAVYDAAGEECNYPPSPLPLNCSGELARADIYLNDVVLDGAGIEARIERLLLHEIGHGLGLTRHSAALGTQELSARYGWR